MVVPQTPLWKTPSGWAEGRSIDGGGRYCPGVRGGRPDASTSVPSESALGIRLGQSEGYVAGAKSSCWCPWRPRKLPPGKPAAEAAGPGRGLPGATPSLPKQRGRTHESPHFLVVLGFLTRPAQGPRLATSGRKTPRRDLFAPYVNSPFYRSSPFRSSAHGSRPRACSGATDSATGRRATRRPRTARRCGCRACRGRRRRVSRCGRPRGRKARSGRCGSGPAPGGRRCGSGPCPGGPDGAGR